MVEKNGRCFASIDLPLFERLGTALLSAGISFGKASENYRLGVAQVHRTGLVLLGVGSCLRTNSNRTPIIP